RYASSIRQHPEAVGTACGDYDILLVVAPEVSHRDRIASGLKTGHPEFLTGTRIESAKFRVRGRCNEYKSARGHNGSAHVGSASLRRRHVTCPAQAARIHEDVAEFGVK